MLLKIFTISSPRCELSPARTLKWPGYNRVQIMCNTLSAHHTQCRVPRGMKGQLSYKVWQSLNRIHLSFILLAEPLNQWRRGGNLSTHRKPLVTSFRNISTKNCTKNCEPNRLCFLLTLWLSIKINDTESGMKLPRSTAPIIKAGITVYEGKDCKWCPTLNVLSGRPMAGQPAKHTCFTT